MDALSILEWIILILSLCDTIYILCQILKKARNNDEHIKSVVEESIKHGRLKDAITPIVNDKYYKLEREFFETNRTQYIKQSIPEVVVSPKPLYDESVLNEKKSSLQTTVHAKESELKNQNSKTINCEEISLPDPIQLFAGVCTDGGFKRIEQVPSEKSIYIIWSDSQNAEQGVISIDPNAYEKVANTPDYLKDACIVSGNGSNVKEVHAGSVVKTNGQWVIKEPIEVELY